MLFQGGDLIFEVPDLTLKIDDPGIPFLHLVLHINDSEKEIDVKRIVLNAHDEGKGVVVEGGRGGALELLGVVLQMNEKKYPGKRGSHRESGVPGHDGREMSVGKGGGKLGFCEKNRVFEEKGGFLKKIKR